jgi:hypothetical protein
MSQKIRSIVLRSSTTKVPWYSYSRTGIYGNLTVQVVLLSVRSRRFSGIYGNLTVQFVLSAENCSAENCSHHTKLLGLNTSPLSLLVGLSRGKVVTFLSGSVPTEKCMGNCRRAVRVPCTSSGFRQLPRNRRENTLGLHTIALFRPARSAPSRCQSHGSRVYMYSIRY